MQTVYMLLAGTIGNRLVKGVYSTPEKAALAQSDIREDQSIREDTEVVPFDTSWLLRVDTYPHSEFFR